MQQHAVRKAKLAFCLCAILVCCFDSQVAALVKQDLGSQSETVASRVGHTKEEVRQNILQLSQLLDIESGQRTLLDKSDRVRSQHSSHDAGAKLSRNTELLHKIRPEQLQWARESVEAKYGDKGDDTKEQSSRSEHKDSIKGLFTKDRPGRRERASEHVADLPSKKERFQKDSDALKPHSLEGQTLDGQKGANVNVSMISSSSAKTKKLVKNEGSKVVASLQSKKSKGIIPDKENSKDTIDLASKLSGKIESDKKLIDNSDEENLKDPSKLAEKLAADSEDSQEAEGKAQSNQLAQSQQKTTSNVAENRFQAQRHLLLEAEDAIGAVGKKLAKGEIQNDVKDKLNDGLKAVQEGGVELKKALPDIVETKGSDIGTDAKAIIDDLKSPDKRDTRSAKISWVPVLWMTILMGGAAGLGSIPFFFVGSLSKEWSALANALACGVMLACSFDLVHEGQPYGGGAVILGIVLGALFISASQKYLEDFEDVKFQGLQGVNARKILLMIGIMSAHAFGEGAGVGVSFCGSRGWAQGVLVTLAIGLHNVPEGLAVSTVLVARGIRARKALLWTLFTAMPQPLVAVPAFLFVDTFRSLLPVALGFAAGCMVWMVFAELLPDALADASHGKVATTATFAAACLEGLRMLLATFEGADGDFSIPAGLSITLLSTGTLLIVLCMFSGVLGGVLGRILVKNSATGLAFSAAIISAQGMIMLLTSRKSSATLSYFGKLAALTCGALTAYLLKSFILPLVLAKDGQNPINEESGIMEKYRLPTDYLIHEQSEKIKEGGTPKRELGGILSAAEEGLNGHSTSNGNGLHPSIDLESGLKPNKKVFQPYKDTAATQDREIMAYLGLLAMFAISLQYGVAMAGNSNSGPRFGSIWLPLGLWALLPGMLYSASTRGMKQEVGQKLAGALFAGIAPGAMLVIQIHREVSIEPGMLTSEAWTVYMAGIAVTTGLIILLPRAIQQSTKRSLAGLTKGLIVSGIINVAIMSLCRFFGPCVQS